MDIYFFFKALEKVRIKQEELITIYNADMAKHAGKVNAMHIDRLWNSIPSQLALSLDGNAHRFRFKHVIPGVNRYIHLVDAIDWLIAAGLIVKVGIVDYAQFPLRAYSKENIFKLLLFDVGILGALGGIPPEVILEYDYGSYKGYFAENFVAQELLNSSTQNLFSWHEKKSEIEFLRVIDGKIIPIEVKSGTITKSKSLAIFAEKYNPLYRVIFSANNLSINKTRMLHKYPLYLSGRFPLQDA